MIELEVSRVAIAITITAITSNCEYLCIDSYLLVLNKDFETHKLV